MFYIIDGTGPYSQKEYDLAMARSFCWQLEVNFCNYWAEYIPGGEIINNLILKKGETKCYQDLKEQVGWEEKI